MTLRFIRNFVQCPTLNPKPPTVLEVRCWKGSRARRKAQISSIKPTTVLEVRGWEGSRARRKAKMQVEV